MSETIDLGGSSLSPDETAYFESGGKTEIPGSEIIAEPEKIPDAEPVKTEPEKIETTNKPGDKTPPDRLLAAAHEERNKRKTVEAEKRALETQLAELRGKFSIIERLQAPPQEQKAPPTAEDDIFGLTNNNTATIAEIQKRLNADDDRRKSEGEQNSLTNAYRMDAAQFRAKSPDFDAAYNHLLKTRADELIAMGYDDPAQLHQALTNDEMSIARMALGSNKSPAEIIYNLAKMRGYAKPEPKPDPDEAAKAAAAASKAASDKIETINRGQAANKSLSNTGGSAGDGDMTGEMLLKMPMDEFETWCTKNPAKAKRLMGG